MNYRLQQQHGSWANAYNRSPPPFPSPPCLLLFLILPSSYSSFLILNHPFFPLALSPLSPPLSLHPLILPPLTLTPLNPTLLLFLLCKPRPPRVPSSASDSFAPVRERLLRPLSALLDSRHSRVYNGRRRQQRRRENAK